MVKTILENAGFVENETFRETRFLKPPRTTYAVFMDAFTRRGADNLNLITDHAYTIELYSYMVDPKAEERIEEALDEMGFEYEKEPRYWIHEEQLFQVVYTFGHIEK